MGNYFGVGNKNSSHIGKTYYKITNENENHHGYQYYDGLNVLEEEFAKIGSCCKGGFYFTDINNIHNFFGYGIYLREITLPTDDTELKVVIDPQGNKWRANKVILGKRYLLSDPATYELLIVMGANINNLVNSADEKSNYDIVVYLESKGAKISVPYCFYSRNSSTNEYIPCDDLFCKSCTRIMRRKNRYYL